MVLVQPSMVVHEPDPDTALRIGWTIAVLGLLVAVVSAVGEILGWWNDLVEVGMTVGALTSLFAGVGAIFFSAERRRVGGVAIGVARIAAAVHGVSSSVHGVASAVALANTKLDGIDGRLGHIGVKLDRQIEKLDELDVIEARRSLQNGVLDRQLTILTQIRDRL